MKLRPYLMALLLLAATLTACSSSGAHSQSYIDGYNWAVQFGGSVSFDGGVHTLTCQNFSVLDPSTHDWRQGCEAAVAGHATSPLGT